MNEIPDDGSHVNDGIKDPDSKPSTATPEHRPTPIGKPLIPSEYSGTVSTELPDEEIP